VLLQWMAQLQQHDLLELEQWMLAVETNLAVYTYIDVYKVMKTTVKLQITKTY